MHNKGKPDKIPNTMALSRSQIETLLKCLRKVLQLNATPIDEQTKPLEINEVNIMTLYDYLTVMVGHRQLDICFLVSEKGCLQLRKSVCLRDDTTININSNDRSDELRPLAHTLASFLLWRPSQLGAYNAIA
uniref:Uncharacterized protein n=1 Tax=Romanomermis culicivorax TaxID=13658 RepID=A0A915I8L6_ROMCU